jgi:hypothetical protein
MRTHDARAGPEDQVSELMSPSPRKSVIEGPPRRKVLALFALLLGVELLLYVGFASRLIHARVGYQYDEAIYVSPAVFVLHGIGMPPTRDYGRWAAANGRRWPLMIIPYVGTTKAFVALPLFALFGITPETARYTGVLLGCLGIAGLVTLIGMEVDRLAGLLVGAALAIHPSYLDLTVFDNGGVSVWMGAMGLTSLALTNHLRRRTRLSAFLLGVAAGLGVWARLNVLWLIASALAAALVVYGRRAIPARDHIRALAIGGCCGALPLILYEAGSGLATLRYVAEARQPLSASRMANLLRQAAELMISDGEQRGIWAGPPLPDWQIGVGAALLACVALCLFARVPSEDSGISRWRRAFALSAVVLAGIMLISGLPIAQHHLVGLLPLALATLAILSVEVVSRFRVVLPLFAAAAAGMSLLLASWDVRIDRGLRQSEGKGPWSSAVEEVRRHLQSHPVHPDRLKILNWGFLHNLYVGSGGSVYGSELFWGATRARSSRGLAWESEILDGGVFLMYVFPTGSPSLDAAAEGSLQALKKYRGPRRERRFFDRSGSPVALLVEIPTAR